MAPSAHDPVRPRRLTPDEIRLILDSLKAGWTKEQLYAELATKSGRSAATWIKVFSYSPDRQRVNRTHLNALSAHFKISAETVDDLIVQLRSLRASVQASAIERLKPAEPEMLEKYAANVRRVKTLWTSMDEAIDLEGFYYRTRIEHPDKVVGSCADLPSGNLVIEGIAGQGKSMFLRHLCSSRLVADSRRAVFVELSSVTRETNVRALIVASLKEIGEETTVDRFSQLAEAGALDVFLDAFDEVSGYYLALAASREISLLASSFPKMRVIVTARPDTPIQREREFRVIRIASLLPREVKELVAYLFSDSAKAKALIAIVDDEGNNVASLLTTPLLTTLLVLTYKHSRVVPQQISEFYQALLPTLLTRHDSTKPGFVRTRKTGLSDRDLTRGFEHLCFIVKIRLQSRRFERDTLEDLAEQALKARRISASPDSFIDDVCQITALIIRDGQRYKFVHESVPEYYCAKRIAGLGKAAEVFYAACLKSDVVWRRYRKELEFLSELDRARYLNLIVVEGCKEIFGKEDLLRSEPPPFDPSYEPFLCSCDIEALTDKRGNIVVGNIYVGKPHWIGEIVAGIGETLVVKRWKGLRFNGVRFLLRRSTDKNVEIAAGPKVRMVRLNGETDHVNLARFYSAWTALVFPAIWERGRAALQEWTSEEASDDLSRLKFDSTFGDED